MHSHQPERPRRYGGGAPNAGVGFWLLDDENTRRGFSAKGVSYVKPKTVVGCPVTIFPATTSLVGFSYAKPKTVVGRKRNYKYDD